jgi:uncharacterized membrane-anchored protein YhcB (DUF1043 family)
MPTGLYARLLILAVVVGLLIGAIVWRKNDISHWKTEGRNALAAEIKSAQEEADKQTREKQAAIKRKTKEEVHEVRKEQGAAVPASPYLRGVLERMRADD